MPRRSRKSPSTQDPSSRRKRPGGLAKLLRQFDTALILSLALGFVLGRALPGAMIAPFGLAWFAAIRASSPRGLRALLAGGAVAGGAWTVLPPVQTYGIALSLVLTHLVCHLLKVGRKPSSPVAVAGLAALSAIIPALQLVRTLPVEMLFWIGVTGTVAQVFSAGISQLTSPPNGERADQESLVPVLVVLAAALCGLENLTIGTAVSVYDAAAALMVLLSVHYGGTSLGATSAAILGISFLFTAVAREPGGLANTMPDVRGMAYLVGGTLAGSFRELGKAGTMIAFSLGLVAYLFVFTPGGPAMNTLTATLAAVAALFLVLPTRLLARLPAKLHQEPEGQDPLSVAAQPAESQGLSQRIQTISGVLREMTHMFEQVAAVSAPPESDNSGANAVQHITGRICQSCSMYGQCWERETDRTTEILAALWQEVNEKGPLPIKDLSPILEQHCIYPAQVTHALNSLHDLVKLRDDWERRLHEGRNLTADHVRNLSRILDRLSEEARDPREADSPAPVLQVKTGSSRLPKRGSGVSGDSLLAASIRPNRHLLLLSDGMGVGREAMSESRQCVSLVERLLSAGFSPEIAIRTVNSVLLVGAQSERFVTVDLALLNLTSAEAEFIKVGAAPSFIKRGDNVTVVKAATPPAGIIQEVEIEAEYRSVRPGDLIILVSDGIWDAAKEEPDKEAWLLSHLRRETSTDPDEIAEGVLARALEIMPDAGDDMTVLVARLDAAGHTKAEPPQSSPSSRTWAAVRRAPRVKDRSS